MKAKALFSSLLLSLAAVLLAGEASAQGIRAGAYSHSSHSASARPSYASSRIWIPGRVETVLQSVWVPASEERVWVEPVWNLRIDACGNPIRVLVCAGAWKTICHPGHYETRPVVRHVPGRWVARGSCR